MNKIKVFFTLFLLCAYVSVQAQPASTIPDFTLFRADKTPFTNKDLNTQKLLFFLFFDVSCIHCQHAIQTINSRYAEMKNTDIHLVTLDRPEDVSVFLNKYGKNLLNKNNVQLFFDLQNEFIIRFKPRKYPSIFLYTPDQRLVLYDDNPENLPKFFEQIRERSK